jgi:crotonobetainyl-CoA:carnitine CoA-transferase CaiB-like acyl-CoA transferase
LARLEAEDLLSAPVQTLSEALASEQTAVNGMVVAFDDVPVNGGNEAVRLIGTPIAMDASAFRLRHAPPKLGADGEAVLRELGYATEKIAAIKAAGVVA